ncbi:tRNA/rRNA methyltransferase [Arsukibacterium sp.]|uniref:tRNA/rRNA methyltransferase n=1 Tax=Arsukibacterium sp. TaxID=1977258 RepID=UPI00299F1A6A|nr:tRNA/rRNA methyltransferase [Arsukibacterium sp.]MDX1538512.1 tRNA/rRNA methyltransferase [Arsukibacterium sp.]
MVDKPKRAGRSQQPRATTPGNKPANKAKHSAAGKDVMQKPWLKKTAAAKSNANPARQSAQSAVKSPAHSHGDESKVYGENACRVLFSQRPEAIIRLYISQQLAPRFADVMKYLAAEKKAYHIVEDAELEKVAASQHHGGIVLLVKRKPITGIAQYLSQTKPRRDCLLALDGVGNPHNLGAIARTCAHFGVTGIIMREPQLLQSGAALRTAEGGGEFISPLSCDDMPLALQLCKQAGYSLVTTSSHNGQSLYQTALPQKVVIVFGEEMFGVSKAVASRADIALQIPGSGKVESLNVSVAASLIVGEWYRQHSENNSLL